MRRECEYSVACSAVLGLLLVSEAVVRYSCSCAEV